MAPNELDPQEAEVAQLALEALTVAQRRAHNSGRSVVVVENGELVRVGLSGKTGLKKLPPRRKVTVRVKRASA
jgi:hypothetical protein